MTSNSKDQMGMAQIESKSVDDKMSQWFQRFSEQTTGSPMYQHLSLEVSRDKELIELAKEADQRQPVPNLFFASVHFLLMKNRSHGLSRYYPSLGGAFEPTPLMLKTFKDFCLDWKNQIIEILKTRLVQTNEVQRCALLRPAINFVSSQSDNKKISLIDIGVSGGLNFLLDKTFIKYSNGSSIGSPESKLQIRCESIGGPIPLQLEEILIYDRIGIDLNPLNLMNEEEHLWNLALIWPDQLERIQRFNSATQLLNSIPISFVKGSGPEMLPQAIKSVSCENLLCVMHSFTLNQFSNEDREKLERTFCENSATRDIWRISLEWIGTKDPEIVVSQYSYGQKKHQQKLAECSGHGDWIRWLQP